MQVGNIIRKYRKDKNLTQEEMAKRLGVTAPAVNKWENGYSLPAYRQIVEYFHRHIVVSRKRTFRCRSKSVGRTGKQKTKIRTFWQGISMDETMPCGVSKLQLFDSVDGSDI
jgi:transcriptional regulator with XRE-family HTH domain